MNECEGCKTYNDINSKGTCNACNIPRLAGTVKCPCVDCLVKGICVKPCTEFMIYADRVQDYHGVHNCEDIEKEKL